MRTVPASDAARALDELRGGRWSAALRSADAALAAGSTEPWLDRLRGVALTNLGRYDEAVALLEAVAGSEPAPIILHELAAARLASGDLAGAQRTVGQALRSDPQAAPTRRAVALLAMRRSEWERAERELRAVVIEDQFDIEALNNLALCLARQGRGPEALELMGQARARGQATRHWRLLERNWMLLAKGRPPEQRHPGPRDGRGDGGGDATPRPTFAAALLRHRYEGRRMPYPGLPASPLQTGPSRLLLGLLVVMVVLLLGGAVVREPRLAAVVAPLVAAAALGVARRRRRLFVVLPTSARIALSPRTPGGRNVRERAAP